MTSSKRRKTIRRDSDYRTIRFDGTINLGNIVSIIILVIAMLQMYQGIASRMDKMEVKVDTMWQSFQTRAEISKQLGKEQ